MKSRFSEENQKKSPLKRRTSFYKSRNENPFIWLLIGSFRAQLQVRLRVFLLIFLPIALDFNFESYITRIVDNFIFYLSL